MRIPIVGAHFHPPAKGVLASLPAGWPLVLIHDEENEYDPLAIRVLTRMDLEEVEEELLITMTAKMNEACEAQGWNGEEIFAQADPCWLGFIAKSGAKTAKGGDGNGEVFQRFPDVDSWPLVASLSFDEDGAACAEGFEPIGISIPVEDPWWERRPWNE